MRQLRLIQLSDDGGHLLLEPGDGPGAERFVLAVDADLREAIAPRSPARPQPAHAAPEEPAPAAEISPREIQTRVRAGESPEELAVSLGVPMNRIVRFAEPVVAERHRIADEARRARARRSTPEAQSVQFGEAVDARFGNYGVVPGEVQWDSHRREDGGWVIVAQWVSAGWFGGEGRHSARWLFERSSRSVAPLDGTAEDLLSDRPIRPVDPPPVARPSLVGATAGSGVVAFPTMPDAHTAPVPLLDPVPEEVFDQEAEPEPEPPAAVVPTLDAPAPAAVARSVPAPVSAPAASRPTLVPGFDEPPLPLGIEEQARGPVAGPMAGRAARHAESDEEHAARARIPSWDDILLGVRRKKD